MFSVDLAWAKFFIYWILINDQWELIFKMNEQYQAYFYQERLIPMLVSINIDL
jgi:plasmid maintenance system killer protein